MEGHHYLDVLADQPRQETLQGRDHAIEIDHAGPAWLPTAEGQELADQGHRSLPGFAYVLQGLARRRGQIRRLEQGGDVPQDDCQEVVEVVRDPAR